MQLMKIKTPYKGSCQWFFKEYQYEIDDTGITYNLYTSIFFVNWIDKLWGYYARTVRKAINTSQWRFFVRWGDVSSYKIFEKEKKILVQHKIITKTLPSCLWVVCTADNFSKVKEVFYKKVGKSKQTH